jgi:hypothetical protein
MARGGSQPPKGPRPPAGPGKFSQRSDGNQPVHSPGLDSPDMQYGDVAKLRQSMSNIPLPGAGGPPRPTSAPGAPSMTPASRSGGLPSFLFDGASGRPNEPGTEGLSTGPGAGPEVLPQAPLDPRVQTLKYLWQTYGNQQAYELMQQLMNEQQQTQAASNAPPPGMPVPGAA